jgi:hypothetical protein
MDDIRQIAKKIVKTEATIEIDENDDDPDALNGGDYPLWVVSTRTLHIDGHPVTSWTRCSVGDYDDYGDWVVDEDTNGGDQLPKNVAVALSVFPLQDYPPDVPEPPTATELYVHDPNGQYAVWWETIGDDAHIVNRYNSYEAAQAVCDEYQREFLSRHPHSGGVTYRCGFGVRMFCDDGWYSVDEEN